jgi:hypothetical protein
MARVLVLACLAASAQERRPEPAGLVRHAVRELLKMEEPGGEWPYEGVYRVQGRIPVGYRVGGTALVGLALLQAAADDRDSRTAVGRALAFVLKGLDDPLMQPSADDAYDVRVWGQASALEFLCRARAAKLADVDARIRELVKTLAAEEIRGGGWNYATRRAQAAFVTAPVVQSLLWARSQGFEVPAELFARARAALEASRAESGAFAYSGTMPEGSKADTRDGAAGSCARSAGCEATLVLLGGGSTDAVRRAVEAFHAHWGELEKRRRKTGTHEGPHSIAPYYFYYGHRYAAQAIELLPAADRPRERARLLEVILRTRDDDGCWNDRVFPRSRNYATAMIALALIGDRAPLPPAIPK